MKRLLWIGLLGIALSPQHVAAKERTIKVTADEMRFEPAVIEVSAGETIRFEVTNRGMTLHEFSVGSPGENAAHRRIMATVADTGDGANSHARHDMAGHHHDHPQKVVMVDPGQTAVLTVRFGQPGRLELACNIPGHYEAGMIGSVAVKP